jgi:hypothetical protein
LKTLRTAIASLALLLPAAMARAQCALCQTALTGSVEGRHMAGHLNSAILLMLFAPYLIIGTFLAVAFRARLAHAARGFVARTTSRPVAN